MKHSGSSLVWIVLLVGFWHATPPAGAQAWAADGTPAAPIAADPASPPTSPSLEAARNQVSLAKDFLAEPTFFVESIEVLGLERAQPEVVISESLLETGREISETELRDAIRRIRRLPFILEASFALRKGSERGRYRLEISVAETLRFFFGEDLTFTRFTNSVAFDQLLAQHSEVSSSSLAGLRFFPGRTTMLHLAAGKEGLQAGITRYNLFDRRIFFSAAFQNQQCCPVQTWSLGLDPTFSSYQNEDDSRQMTLTVGMPLRGNHSLRFQLMRSESEEGERRNLLGPTESRALLRYRDLVHQRVELAWSFNTADDPVLPTRGLTFSTVLDAQELSVSYVGNAANLPRFRGRQTRLSVGLTQHWPLTPRQALSASARLGVGMAEVDNLPVVDGPILEGPLWGLGLGETQWTTVDQEDLSLAEGFFTLRYSVALWSAAQTRDRGDFRWEVGVDFGYDRTTPDLDLPDNPLYRKGVMTSLVFRNEWGVFRATLQIADYGRGF